MRITYILGIAALAVAMSSAAAQNPPVRNPPVRQPPQRGGAAGQTVPGRNTTPPVPATHSPRWVGCYDVAIADTSGALRAYGTFDLDSITPARGIGGHFLASVIGGSRMMRAGWQDGPGDSLRLTAAYVDAGFTVVMGPPVGDSLHGYVKGSGAGATDPAASTPAAARRRASCAKRVPAVAMRPGVASLEADFTTITTHPPLVAPAWLLADSMIVKQPKGKSYVHNVLLMRFNGGNELQRHAIVQSLGGMVVGSILPAREDRDNMLDFVFIVYVEDGATIDDLQRIAARAKWSPIVQAIAPYYK